MKIYTHDANDINAKVVVFSDPGYPVMVQVETSDGQVFQMIERHRGQLEFAAVRNKTNHAAALSITPRSSNLIQVRATRL